MTEYETMIKNMKEDRLKGASIRALVKLYPLKKHEIHHLVSRIIRPCDIEKKERTRRMREIMAEWKVSRPSAKKIYEIALFINKNPECCGILDKLRAGEIDIKTAHGWAMQIREDYLQG